MMRELLILTKHIETFKTKEKTRTRAQKQKKEKITNSNY